MKPACATVLVATVSLCSACLRGPSAAPRVAGHPRTGCGRQAIRYEIKHTGGSTFAITARFPPSRGGLDLAWRQATNTKDGPVDFISGLQIRDGSGQWRSPAYVGKGTWRPTGTAGYTALRYRLNADHDRAVWDIGKEEIAYRFDEAFYFVGSPVLIANLGWKRCRFDVRFVTPPDWTTVTPWKRSPSGSFAVDGLRQLLRNIFVTGPGLQPRPQRISGIEVTILEQKSLRPSAPIFSALLAKSIGRYVEIFGSSPIRRYLVVFGEGRANDGGAFAQSFGQRMPAPLRHFEKLMWARASAHEALHNWIGITIRPQKGPELQWFTEGGADYLTGKTLYRVGEIDENDLIFILEGQVRRFLLGRLAGGRIDLREAGAQKQRHRQLIYGGGALFHLFLDAHLTAKKGLGSYEKLMRKLYDESATAYSFERLMTTLNAASDGAAREIFGFLNARLDPATLLARLRKIGLPTSAFGPDELLVRFAGGKCTGSRDARCVPAYLAR